MEYGSGLSRSYETIGGSDMNLLYEDKDILVVEKPAGIPVETSRIGSKDMVSLLRNHLAETVKNHQDGIPYLGMIHRLDQPVQGVMIFAKNQKAAASLSKEIAQNEMKKTYLAVVEGKAKEAETLTDFLLKDGRTNTSRKVPKGTKGAKEARLSYECLKILETPDPGQPVLSLVRIHLFTGRHHQIRVQMASAGLPLYGDRKYNPVSAGPTLALCAFELTFRHPSTRKSMTFSCQPAGEIFRRF